MTETPHETLATRALGGLFLPSRPKLGRFAAQTLHRELMVGASDLSQLKGFGNILWATGGSKPLVHLRPSAGGGHIAPDIVLHTAGSSTARVVGEVKLAAKPQASQLSTVMKLSEASGVASAKVRDANKEGSIAQTQAGIPGVWQLDAYFAWNWSSRFTVEPSHDVLTVDPERAVFALFSLNGVRPEKMFKGAASCDWWCPVDLRMFVAALNANRHIPLHPIQDSDEWDAISALTYLVFAADTNTAGDFPSWLRRVTQEQRDRLKPT